MFAVHVDQKRELVAGGHVRAELHRHGDRRIGDVLPAVAAGQTCLPLSKTFALIPSPGNATAGAPGNGS
jgi:hypothetical protein